MNDLPQGGAGGVPLDHDEQDPRHPLHGDSTASEDSGPDQPETVKTVRGGTTVGTQQAGRPAPQGPDGQDPAKR